MVCLDTLAQRQGRRPPGEAVCEPLTPLPQAGSLCFGDEVRIHSAQLKPPILGCVFDNAAEFGVADDNNIRAIRIRGIGFNPGVAECNVAIVSPVAG